MARTVADTIKYYTKKHLLENNGVLLSQCVQAVGWIGGTVPELTENDGIVELPTCDVAGPGFAIGYALAGRRPIFIARYQGFMWYNAATLINYAAKSKEIWNTPCPVFIRSIGMERNGIGPVAASCHHGMFLRMPGIPICAPMTSNEWESVWHWYLNHDDPIYVSEHRLSFVSSDEIPDQIMEKPDVTLVCISASRMYAGLAIQKLQQNNIQCSLINVLWIKPFAATECMFDQIKKSKFSVVIDSDFEIGGASRSIAYEIMLLTGKQVYAYGLKDKTCGVAKHTENCTPDADMIVNFVLEKYYG